MLQWEAPSGGSSMYKVYLIMAQMVFNSLCLFINEEKL